MLSKAMAAVPVFRMRAKVINCASLYVFETMPRRRIGGKVSSRWD